MGDVQDAIDNMHALILLGDIMDSIDSTDSINITDSMMAAPSAPLELLLGRPISLGSRSFGRPTWLGELLEQDRRVRVDSVVLSIFLELLLECVLVLFQVINGLLQDLGVPEQTTVASHFLDAMLVAELSHQLFDR